ncbi:MULTISPECIES: ATP-binding protein [Streptomyces]|uniref:ATP-binding protein n=1 Tax=Streptomyces TaxID=1883 RepID=UPI000CF267D3|nr:MULTISPECIES: ATP-binding protein [Streptomyces]
MPTETATPGDEQELKPLSLRFPSSPHGAQLARRHAVRWMEQGGYPPASDATCAVALVVGELAANAVRHGRVPGRDFGLRLALDRAADLLRIEIADAASAKRLPTAAPSSHPEGESGRGLLLVDALAARWGSAPRRPVGKTVWAELRLPSESAREHPPAGAGVHQSQAPLPASRATTAAIATARAAPTP